MARFHLAVRTHPGRSTRRDVFVGMPGPITDSARMALACGCADPAGFSTRAQPILQAASTPAAALHALAPWACLTLFIEPAAALVRVHGRAPQHAAPLHYLRLADATVKPLPPDPAPLHLLPGDTYLALTPGALALADSPAIARFIHLRDYFNAEKMAAALLDHLLAQAGAAAPSDDITLLVHEAR